MQRPLIQTNYKCLVTCNAIDSFLLIRTETIATMSPVFDNNLKMNNTCAALICSKVQFPQRKKTFFDHNSKRFTSYWENHSRLHKADTQTKT